MDLQTPSTSTDMRMAAAITLIWTEVGDKPYACNIGDLLIAHQNTQCRMMRSVLVDHIHEPH